jgi:hypothetical protein
VVACGLVDACFWEELVRDDECEGEGVCFSSGSDAGLWQERLVDGLSQL